MGVAALRIPENDELPDSQFDRTGNFVPVDRSVNSRVIGIGSVIDTFQEIALPLTVPSKISAEFPSAI